MWYNHLDNTKFLTMLYDEIPKLESVSINNLLIRDSGNHLKIMFDLPRYPAHPPKKWHACNVASIEIDFFCLKSLYIESSSNTYMGEIDISEAENGLLKVCIQGSLKLIAIAETGFVQRIEGYIKSLE